MQRQTLLAITALMTFGLWIGELSGQDKTAPALPGQPALWINSLPPSPEAFAGKGVVLWFFEEDCPRCAAKWPEMMELSQKYAGKPVIFIAVNSGNPRQSIEQYVRQHKINWPVMVDPTRAIEPLFDVQEISLNNIYQARLIMPDGSWEMGSISNLPASIDRVLENAKWNVDPATMPEELKPTWQMVEFGNYSGAAIPVQKAMKSSKPDVKQAAEQLQQFVQDELDKRLASAKTALESDQKWEAYKLYSEIPARFKGYDVPSEVAANIRTLSRDRAIDEELKAMKMLELAKKSLNGTPVGERKAKGLLEKIRNDYPTTEAAAQIQKEFPGL